MKSHLRKNAAPAAVTAFALLFLSLTVQGAIITVGQDAKYCRIQDAIDSASPGDEIEVENGTYAENVEVSKPIKLRGIGNPVVDANGLGCAIVLSADGAVLEGFHVINSNQAGIKVTSCGNIIKNNSASGNSIGIDLLNSNHNLLRDNLLDDNLADFEAMFLRYDLSFDNDIDTSNLVGGKPIYYIVNASEKVIDKSSNAGVVYCIGCKNVSVRGLELRKNAMGIILVNCNHSILENNIIQQNKGGGIFLQGSQNNIIKNNSILDNDRAGIFLSASCNNTVANNRISNDIYGIFLLGSSYNILEKNVISRNKEGLKLFQGCIGNKILGNEFLENEIGISVKNSFGNQIFLNNFENNVRQADPGSNNFWNSTEPKTYSYMGKRSTDYIGNFWSDYADGDDLDDGLGDEPFDLDPEKDWHPLISRYETYELKKSIGDALDIFHS
jgi:parallel beta-helix repeat protein